MHTKEGSRIFKNAFPSSVFTSLSYLRLQERFNGDNDKGTYVILEKGKMLQKWDQCASS